MSTQFKTALRSLSNTPGFTVVAVLTLAVGIGACTAMFSLMNTLLLRPLVFPDSHELVQVERVTKNSRSPFSPADFLDLRAQENGFGQFGAFAFSSVSLAERGAPAEWQNSLRVTHDFFNVLGAAPMLGRTFRAEETIQGNHRVILLTHLLWEERFNNDPKIVGRVVRLNGEPHEVIGVLPPEAYERRMYGNAKLFVPLAFTDAERAARNMHWLNVIGRRAANVSESQGQAFLNSVSARSAADHVENKDASWRAQGLLASTMREPGKTLVKMLVGLSAFVLLIACSNLANLLLARAIGRTREFAVRAALGASRMQLVFPLTFEALLLALLGGSGAVLIAKWTCDWLQSQITDGSVTLYMDWRVLTFTLAASLITILFFGIAPALFAMRVKVNEALKNNARGSSASRGHQRFRSALIIAQFALAMMLIAGAGYFVRGAGSALSQSNGWNSKNVLQGSVHLPKGYKSGAELNAFWAEIARNLQRIPGVEFASVSYDLPYKSFNNERRYIAQGRGDFPKGTEPRVNVNGITDQYFQVTGARLLSGRSFDGRDTGESSDVAIISQSLARELFAERNPIGGRIAAVGQEPPQWLEVVGVVEDARPVDVARAILDNQVYQPIWQDHWYFGEGRIVPFNVAVRTKPGADSSVSKAIREAISLVDPDLPIRQLGTADALIAQVGSQMNVIKDLLVAFAAIGLFLASLGIYGVLSRTVAQRTAEIGIRMALGAQVRDMIRLILNFGLRLAAAGAAIGFLGALGISKLINSALPSMKTGGATVLPLATALLVLVGLIACYLPARRAARINPIAALREE